MLRLYKNKLSLSKYSSIIFLSLIDISILCSSIKLILVPSNVNIFTYINPHLALLKPQAQLIFFSKSNDFTKSLLKIFIFHHHFLDKLKTTVNPLFTMALYLKYKNFVCLFNWRTQSDLNQRSGSCSPTPYHLAMDPNK